MRDGRILIVEDRARWRRMLTLALGEVGYSTDAVSSQREARERLETNLYHLLVLDIRMEEGDPENLEGMDLLRHLHETGQSEALSIIMLSAYGTPEQMREAFRDYGVTDFQEKQKFSHTEFAKHIQSIFDQEAKIKFDLQIHWQRVQGPEDVVSGLKVAGARVKRQTPRHQRVATELDDLLCRLFFDAESLVVEPLASGHGGGAVLRVQPFYSERGSGRPVVVKFGDAADIESEGHNFSEFVQPFLGGGRSTTVLQARRTPLLGGIVYSLLGAAQDRFEDFGHFYQRSDSDEIREVLDRLFLETCGPWYANPGNLQHVNLTSEYQQMLGFTAENLEVAFKRGLKAVQGKQMLHFSTLAGNTFPNPIPTTERHLVRSTYRCTTHGDLNEGNILLDDQGACWLIDFLRTGAGHILRDFAELDSVVRIQLLGAEEAPLPERLALERALLDLDPTREGDEERLAASLPTNEALRKSFAVTAHLRRLAGRQVAPNTGGSPDEYAIASFYCSINSIRYFGLPTVQREHALLSAALLAERLDL